MFSFVTGKSRKTARNGYTFPPNLYKSIIYIIHIYILVNCIIPLSVLLLIYIFVNCVYIYNLYKLENKFIVILDVTFPFILPGWKTEKTQTGFLMISPKMATDRRRAENDDCSGGRGLPLGSVRTLDPTTRGGGQSGLPTVRTV